MHEEPSTVSRRQLLGGAAALFGGLAVAATTGTAPAAASERLRLTVPAPTGPHDVGTASLHLVDHDRQDPWWTTPHPRELMVSLWYPTRNAGHCRLAPWMPTPAVDHYRTKLEEFIADLPPNTPVSLSTVDFPVTHAREGAPLVRSGGPYPVVLYSHGFGASREMGTTLVEDLASQGYVVVAISHTYEAEEVQFPGGRVVVGRNGADQPSDDPFSAVTIRRQDAAFVIDQLAELNGGHNPDAGHRPLPAGLRGSLDLARIGMFGHSLGGAATAQTMAHDGRVVAGVNLDGSFVPNMSPPRTPVVTPEEAAVFDAALVEFAGLLGTRPFMVMGSNGQSPDEFGGMTSLVWHNLRGWRRFVSLVGSTHGSYTDHLTLLNQLADAGLTQPAAPWVGTIDPARGLAAERAYVHAFFDLWLRDHDSHLLDGPSAQYPEAVFFP